MYTMLLMLCRLLAEALQFVVVNWFRIAYLVMRKIQAMISFLTYYVHISEETRSSFPFFFVF